MLAFRLKPKKTDEYRKHWNMYHHFLGYALLAVISVNIFQGISIVKPVHTWKWVYIGILGAFAIATLVLEIKTWEKFNEQKKKENEKNKNKDSSKSSDQEASKPVATNETPGPKPG